jgi:hypothetical protein
VISKNRLHKAGHASDVQQAVTKAEEELHEQLVSDSLAGDALFFFSRPRLVLLLFRLLAFMNSYIVAHILFNWWQELTEVSIRTPNETN